MFPLFTQEASGTYVLISTTSKIKAVGKIKLLIMLEFLVHVSYITTLQLQLKSPTFK